MNEDEVKKKQIDILKPNPTDVIHNIGCRININIYFSYFWNIHDRIWFFFLLYCERRQDLYNYKFI